MDELGNYHAPNGQVIPPNVTAYGQPVVRDLSTNMGASLGSPTGTLLGGEQPTPTLGERFTSGVSGFFNDPMAAIKGLPDYAKYAGTQAATQGLSNLFVSEPEISPMETAALEERKRLRQLEEAAQARNQALGDQYMQQAQAINPVNFGMETAAAQSARLQRGQQAGLRNLTGAQRTAAQRRAALDQARIGGSAFNQGYGRGLQERMAGISRAAGTGANYAALGNMASNDLQAAQVYRNRLNQERANAAGALNPLLAGGVFGMTDAERRAQEKRLKDQQENKIA